MKDLYLLEDNSRLQNGTHQVCGAQEAEFKICETSAICSDFNAMLLKYFLLSSHIFEYLDEGLFVGFSFRIVFVLLDFGPRALKNVKRVVSCGFGCLELCRFDPWDASSGAYLVVFFLVLKLVLKVFSMFKLFKTHKHLRMIKLLKLLKLMKLQKFGLRKFAFLPAIKILRMIKLMKLLKLFRRTKKILSKRRLKAFKLLKALKVLKLAKPVGMITI
mmetsp:Transcript_69162/g.184318  ORF Transcript_69162/g.184318 Transcript_69162/m.184318 type:complete len:217 (-) Transcript_69162:330-980(-)